jgi:MFS family permease
MRILQGVGGAMMVPVGRLVVLKNTPKPKLMNAIATITWPGLVAPVLGPPLGGAITTYASWRWIFYLNLPLGILAFVLALWLVPKRRSDNTRQFDWFGFVASGLGFLSLMYGAELLGREGAISWGPVLSYLIVGGILGGFAVRHFRRTAQPMIDLHALSYPSFAVTIWGGSLFRISISVIPFLLPLMFQLAFGMDAFHSGLLVLAVFAGNLLMKPGVNAVLRYIGFKNVLVYNGVLNAVTLLLCGFLTPATPTALIVLLLFVGGLSRSLQFTALNTIAFADVPQTRMNGASTLFSTAMQLSTGLGIAIGAVALRAGGALSGAANLSNTAVAVASNAASNAASTVASRAQGFGHVPLIDFRLAFMFVSVMAFLAIIDCLKLPADVGKQLAQRRA